MGVEIDFAADEPRGPEGIRLGVVPLAAVALILSVLAAGATVLDAECLRWRTAFAGMPVRRVTIETSQGSIVLAVKVADTPERQAAGFQCATRQEIQQNLILFDFGTEILTQFHMQNVPVPLDIAFAKTDGRIFAILRMEPSRTALYGPLGPFHYALEAHADFFAMKGITPGTANLRSMTPRPLLCWRAYRVRTPDGEDIRSVRSTADRLGLAS